MNLASSMTPSSPISHFSVLYISSSRLRTSISIRREVCRPLHERGSLIWPSGYSVAANCRDDAGIGEGRSRGDDGVCDEVIDSLMGATHQLSIQCRVESGGRTSSISHRVLLLLHFLMSAILEGPLNNVSLGRSTLNVVALGKLRPEVVKVLKLDQVPYIA